mmetsp:Transcript_49820/g.128181  ORF Transcript_49820/g.128181 Transcript_49820/m.128181 type:complete len:117 (+) Transcript_49820:1045-1395(+)
MPNDQASLLFVLFSLFFFFVWSFLSFGIILRVVAWKKKDKKGYGNGESCFQSPGKSIFLDFKGGLRRHLVYFAIDEGFPTATSSTIIVPLSVWEWSKTCRNRLFVVSVPTNGDTNT